MPVPRQAHRTSFRGGGAKTFDPQSKKLIELRALTWCQLEEGHEPWSKENPVCVTIECHFPIPKSWNVARKKMAAAGYEHHVYVPDVDNMAKLYMDAIKGIVFEDDSQVVGLMVVKSYQEKPAVIITCTLME
jgi:Holliday junction resolvase RusA-like endonuclease